MLAAIALNLFILFPTVFVESAPGPSPRQKKEAVAKALREARSVTVYSVASGVYDHFGNARPQRSSPHDAAAALDEGDGVFGAVEVLDAKTIATIGDAFLDGYLEDGPTAFCYIPHHVLRFKGPSGELQIHICFSCHYAAVLLGPATKYDVYQDVSELEPLLDSLLAKASVPVKQPWKAFELPNQEREYVAQELGRDVIGSLETAERLELYSLDPKGGWDGSVSAETNADVLRARLEGRTGILGSTVIERESVRGELLARAFAAIRRDATAARCFEPRHALVFTQGTRTVIVLVSFECGDLYVVADRASELLPIRDVAGLESRLASIFGSRGIAN